MAQPSSICYCEREFDLSFKLYWGVYGCQFLINNLLICEENCDNRWRSFLICQTMKKMFKQGLGLFGPNKNEKRKKTKL